MFEQVAWDERLIRDSRALIDLALREDLDAAGDITTQAAIDPDASGAAEIVAREAGVAAGVRLPALVLQAFGGEASWTSQLDDGAELAPGVVLGRLEGTAHELLATERTILNLMSRLCGVATLTTQYVDRVAGTAAKVCDTRKTTPGWRRLEKFAVACGGGSNHRVGLYDAILIKDNHLAFAGHVGPLITEGVRAARNRMPDRTLEIEVDTLEQFAWVLPAEPDIVLLDNMTVDELRTAVGKRDAEAPKVALEASGGVRLDTIAEIAATGVDRISVGALTHSARSLDLGLDWRGPAG